MLTVVALGGVALSCAQPRIDCTTGRGGFAARYTLVAGSKQGEGSCDSLKGEIVGLEKYNPGQMGEQKTPDLTRAVLAIQASTLGNLASTAEGAGIAVDRAKVVSLGDFASTTPDAEDVCRVPTLTPSEVALPAIDTAPATDVRYAWSNVRVRVTPAYPGTQMAADLTITQDGCSAAYKVLGLWPAVGCEKLDDNGNGTGQPDASRCDPEADPDAGRPTGSGINPDFKSVVACDPELLLCVLTEAPEALR
jgi:hypothetical protein